MFDIIIKYNLRAKQTLSSNRIGWAIPFLTIYFPQEAVEMFSRPGY